MSIDYLGVYQTMVFLDGNVGVYSYKISERCSIGYFSVNVYNVGSYYIFTLEVVEESIEMIVYLKLFSKEYYYSILNCILIQFWSLVMPHFSIQDFHSYYA